MNATKQKILTTSLQLFNSNGVSNVSLRIIADKIGISVGNLQYHFKKREDIIEALYFEIVAKIDAIIIVETTNLLASFFSISARIFEILYAYRFFLLDFVTITRNNKKIKKHYATISIQRQQEFLNIVALLVENGILKKASLNNEYENLYKRVEVLSNFWFSSVLIQAEIINSTSVDTYKTLVSQSIYPYLTESAKTAYIALFPNQR